MRRSNCRHGSRSGSSRSRARRSRSSNDVAGRLDRLVDSAPMLEGVVRSLMPAAIGRGLVTASDAHALIARLHDSVAEDPDRPLLWPLLLGAWKRKGS